MRHEGSSDGSGASAERRRDARGRAGAGPDLFFCPLTLRFEALCPLGPGWGCPHAPERDSAEPGADAACSERRRSSAAPAGPALARFAAAAWR